MHGRWILLAVLGLSAACIRTNSVTLGRKTDLEKQLMGRIEPLTEDELLAASVRGEPDTVTGSLREREDRAIAARRRQLFNRDDIRALAAAGCIGEARNGSVLERDCEGHPLLDQRERFLAEENADRTAVIEWAIEADPSLTQGDAQQLRSIYHSVMVEQAISGTPVEREDGTWVRKE